MQFSNGLVVWLNLVILLRAQDEQNCNKLFHKIL